MAALEPSEPDVDDDLDDGDAFAALFVDECYSTQTFVFGDLEQKMLCSQAASTDFDLTGMIIWPVSIFLAWFVASRRDLFEGQVVLELGAGCGLPGVVAARVGAMTSMLTDGSDVVMRLLKRQVAQAAEDGLQLLAEPLLWGDEKSFSSILSHVTSQCGTTPSVLIGADVVCWPNCVIPFLQTVKAFFLAAPKPTEAVMFIGYVCRATNTRDQFFEAAGRMGLRWKKIEAESFLPQESSAQADSPCSENRLTAGSSSKSWYPENVHSEYDLEVLKLELNPDCPEAFQPTTWSEMEEGVSMPF